MANKVKTLRVRAVPGICVSASVHGTHDAAIAYVGRAHDPKGDKDDLESEFPCSGVVEVKNDPRFRKCVADGDLEAADEATAAACGLKSKPAKASKSENTAQAASK